MRNSKNINRIIAVILSAFMLFSALPSLGIFASAEEISGAGASYVNKVTRTSSNATTNDVLFKDAGISLVKARPETYKAEFNSEKGAWEETFVEQESDASFLADRDIENKYFYNNSTKHYDLANHFMCGARDFATKADAADENGCNVEKFHIDGTEYAVDIVHDLGKEESVKKVIIAQHTTAVLRAGHYYLYASNDRYKLFNDENLVYKNVYDHVGTRSQVFTFTQAITARYVAIRVFNPYSTNDETELRSNGTTKSAGNAYIRMFEFNVFGVGSDIVENREYNYKLKNDSSAENPETVPEYTYNDELKGKNNLVINRTPSWMFFKKGDAEPVEAVARLSGAGEYAAYFTDGDCSTAAEIYTPNNQGHKFVEGEEILDEEDKMYLQLNYKLDGVAKVSDIELFFHDTDDLSAGHIKVAVADKEENLFSSASGYTSSDIYSIFGSVTKVNLGTAKEGQYVGIRIICPVKKCYKDLNNAYMRLSEVSVYGNYSSTVGSVNYRYRIDGTNSERTGNAQITYTGNPDSNGKFTVGTTAEIKAPASVRDTSGNLHSFVRWENGSKEILGEDIVLEMTLNNAVTNVYAIYGKSNKTVTFTFKDYWGNTIHTATVPFGQFVSRSDYEAANEKLGDVPGKELLYSEFQFGSRVASMPVWNVDIYNYAADADATFTPKYVTAAKTYNVTLNGEPVKDGEGNVIKNVKFDQKITLTDNTAGYWTVNEVEWCEGTDFVAYVTEDMAIKPLSGSKSQMISLAKNPVISGSSVGFAAKLMLPKGANVTECGLLLVSGGSEGITLSTAEQKIVAQNRSGEEFMVTVTNLPRKVTRRAVMYVTYNGVTRYSNEVSVTMP